MTLFPDTQRVKYAKNPLEQVICQLRFPPILEIDRETPDKFQNHIREKFPEYRAIEERASNIEVGPGRVPAVLSSNVIKNHAFFNAENTLIINLSRTFISYATKEYTQWEEFRGKLIEIEDFFREVYSPSYYVRLGLRYIDRIKRYELGLEDVPWRELLNPAVTGLLTDDRISPAIKSLATICSLALPENEASVRFATNLVKDPDNQKISFVIDTDFSIEKRYAPDEYLTKLEYLHDEAYRCIKWCIEDRLHNAMEPEPITNG